MAAASPEGPKAQPSRAPTLDRPQPRSRAQPSFCRGRGSWAPKAQAEKRKEKKKEARADAPPWPARELSAMRPSLVVPPHLGSTVTAAVLPSALGKCTSMKEWIATFIWPKGPSATSLDGVPNAKKPSLHGRFLSKAAQELVRPSATTQVHPLRRLWAGLSEPQHIPQPTVTGLLDRADFILRVGL